MKKIIALTALLLVAAAPAWADTFQVNPITITIVSPSPNPHPDWLTLASTPAMPLELALNEGQSTTIDLIQWTTPGDNFLDAGFSVDFRVAFNMTLPAGATSPFQIGGAVRAEVPGNGQNKADTLGFTFGAPVQSYWGPANTGRLDIGLIDESFPIQTGSTRSGSIRATFTYTQAPDADSDPEPTPVPVPEPASMLLLGTGLVATTRRLMRRRG